MSELVFMLVFLGAGAWYVTDALQLLCPHLTARQRWVVVAYLATAAGCVSLALEVGAR